MIKGKILFADLGLFSINLSQEIILKDDSIEEPSQKVALKRQINKASCDWSGIIEGPDINCGDVHKRDEPW